MANQVLETWRKLQGMVEQPRAAPYDLRLLSPDEASAAATPFRSLIDLWLSRRGDATVPDWSSFEFADFRGWHEWLGVSVFPGDEPDPCFRILGEGWKSISSFDFTGLCMSEYLPRLYRLQLRAHMSAIRETGCIGLCAGQSALVNREFVHLQIVELPVRRGGERIDGLIHAIEAQRQPA